MGIKLEKDLVLNKYFLNLFGFDDFNELREKVKDMDEGYDSTGRSFFLDVLVGLKPEWENELLKYDSSIRKHIEKLIQNRNQPNFNLKYFQYLAVLFTEIFLDRFYNSKQVFLNELNEFLKKFNNENKAEISEFTAHDLEKLAFWMATGSGKTLIMHINYWQILKYSKNSWDNILLITPNEGLSRQHYEELKLSGIPCKLYDGNNDNLKTKSGEVLVIDIHKLTREKKGQGVTVDISYFDGKNLVFIDEGHKGQKSEEQTWKNLREIIAKDGFLFEYSATFGQVIGKNKDLLEEYSKAIIFDYSYKYFYTDGYGKDFYVYNIQAQKDGKKEIYSTEQQKLIFIAGLLSFYEQLLIFKNHREEIKKYNIEKPLWIFVGSKVTGKGLNSDVIKVINFLDETVKNQDFLKSGAEKILSQNSGLIDSKGNDIFEGKFEYIRHLPIEELLIDLYQEVFGGRGNLELFEIKNADGELGLKVSTAEKYFGVINVGDINALKKLIENIEVKTDNFTNSLFFDIQSNNSPINILVGSKKFVEGWNSWRVSNMALINMGKSEGAQIIQLFGRGVRLKGWNYSLKREEAPHYNIKILQTLFIFGLNADYINAFLGAIDKEEVKYEELKIPIKFNNIDKWHQKLYTIKTKEDFDFLEYPIKLDCNEDILQKINIDLRPKIGLSHGLDVGKVDTKKDVSLKIPEDYFILLDWNKIYDEILDYKIVNKWFNLEMSREKLKEIIKSSKYKICISETQDLTFDENGNLKITSFRGLEKFHELIILVLKEYVKRFYNFKEKQELHKHIFIEKLTSEHSNMYPEDKKIILKIPNDLASDIEKIKEQIDRFLRGNIPNDWQDWKSFVVHFDKHLYSPLIIWSKNQESIKSFPVKLNQGETQFVKDIKKYMEEHRSEFDNKEVFILRNLSKKGIGFFLNAGFYPDFIIWVKEENKQRIVFVDPKGIRNLGNFNDDKIQFCVSGIKEIESKIREELKKENKNIILSLDAYIISITSYENIKEIFGEGDYKIKDFENKKIYFIEKKSYFKSILNV